MPHNPLKEISIKFHDAKGVTTPNPMPAAPSDAQGGGPRGDMAKVPAPTPQTKLDPLEEALFPHWATANGIDPADHSSPDNHYDYRGMYKQSNGQVHPNGAIANAAASFNKLKQSPLDMNKLLAGGTPAPQPAAPGPLSGAPQDDPIRSLINMLGSGGGGQ